MWKALVQTNATWGQLFVRLALGVVMFPHGAQKVLGWYGGPGFVPTLQIFAGMGFPAWSTVLLMVFEFLGSLLIIAGFLTRIWALGIGISLAICMFMNHVQHGFFMNWFGNQQGEGFEFHLLVIGMALALIVHGAGPVSIDHLIGRDKPSLR